MGRIREKVTPSLRKAIEEIGLNVGPPPNPEHPNFMPRWDFSQSTDKITGKNTRKRDGVGKNKLYFIIIIKRMQNTVFPKILIFPVSYFKFLS